jgi:hypothetical protein
MLIPDEAFWEVVSGFGAAMVSFAVHTTWRMSKCITRTEHEILCKEKHVQVTEQLNEIKRLLGAQDVKSEEYRMRISDHMQVIQTKIAVAEAISEYLRERNKPMP